MYGGGVMYCISMVGEYIGSDDCRIRSGKSVPVQMMGVAGGTGNTGKWGLTGVTGVFACWPSPSEQIGDGAGGDIMYSLLGHTLQPYGEFG